MNEQSPMCALLLNIAMDRIAKYQRIEHIAVHDDDVFAQGARKGAGQPYVQY